jgi:hypothetical protein
MAELDLPSCVRGYHEYKSIWNPAIGQEFRCVRERGNQKDRYAVAVIDAGIVVGHLP